MKRRLTAILLIVVMLTGLLPLNVLAADSTASAAESIFLSQSQVQLQVGQQIALTAKVRPENASAKAVWVSENESIATIDNGVITAVASGNTTVSLEVGSLRALCRVTVSPKYRDASQDNEITVYFSILGDSKHGNNGEIHTLAAGNLIVWAQQAAYTIPEGSTVKDLFLKVADEKGYTYDITHDGTYIAAINDLYEIENGRNSGWMYLRNGYYPNLSVDAQVLSDGDAIVLHYTDDYTQEFSTYSTDPNIHAAIEENKAVIGQISKLEEVTIADEKAIQEARDAYDALSEGQKLVIGNYLLLTQAEVTLAEALIDEIPEEITLDCENTIVHALSAYNRLSDDQKAQVENREKLTAAEETLNALRTPIDRVIAKIAALPEKITLADEEAIADARAAYDLLSAEEKEFITNYQTLTDAEDALDHLKAAVVEDLVAAIPDKTAPNFEQAVLQARAGYDGLTEKQKTYVENLETLTAAEQTLDTVKADAVTALIADIPEEITLDHESKVLEARTAYDALTDAQKALVGNYSSLVTAERKLEMLKLPSAEKIYQQTGDYLAAKGTPGVGSTNGEWRVIGLKRSGREVSTGYYDNVVDYVCANIDADERLSPYSSTDNSRVILALTAMGYDVTAVAGHNLLAGLDEMAYIRYQGINGPIWALIALDCHAYTPTGDVTRDKLIQEILDAQLTDGGWAFAGTQSESDLTAMAIQALAPYYSTSTKAAVDKALTCLSQMQNADGGYGLMGTATCESAAQVIVALSALGIDADTDSRFVKNGLSVLDAMCTYAVDGGGFAHISGGNINAMATEQGYYALTAYFRRKASQTSLYEMSDVTIVQTHYPILSGGDSTWNADAGTYTIVVDAPFAEFTGVKVDGAAIDSSSFTARAGSTHVTFRESYLKTLSLGVHSITLVFKDSTVTTSLTVTQSDAELAKKVEDLIDSIGTVTKDSKAKIEAAREAYNALTTTQKAKVSNYSKLTAAEKAYAALADRITVYFTLLGDSKHGDNGQIHTLAQGGLQTWISRTAYTLEPQATVLDLFAKAVDGKYSYVNKGNYISSVNGLAEFTNGKNSGWMYTLNGTHPNLGVEEQRLSDGDEVVWHYTDDYTYEEGGSNYGKPTGNAAKNVDTLIDKIGTVTFTEECKQNIDAARKAYDALSDTDKQKVTKRSTLEAAEKKYDELKKADDNAKAQVVIGLIQKLGTPTLNSDGAINAAWNAYNSLTADQKTLVTNLSTLQEATQKWNQLEAEEVIKLIDKIDDPITQQSEKAIGEARAAYDKLSNNQKKLVNNYRKLTDAETALAKLNATEEDKRKAQEVIDRIKKLTNVTLDSEKDIQDARKAYDALSDLQKKLVENYDVLEAAERKLALLKALGKVGDSYTATGDYMEKLGTPSVGSIGGEWMVIGLARSDREIPNVADYYQSVVDYVRENIDENQRLHKAKSTDNSRLILALTALGKDVTDVDGHNLLLGLNDLDFVKKQGNNGTIWALLALDSGNYPVPAGNVTRQALIEEILSVQTSDGGWAISGDEADSDMTGMALQALAPYYKTDLKIQEAVDKAMARLFEMQNDDGGFSTFGGGGKVATSESVAQVIVALTALGINPDTDERFVKNGNSAIDALLEYYVKGGGFKHVLDNQIDGMATEQAYYALTAYYRFLSGKTSLYDMTDVIDMGGDPVEIPEETTVPATTEPAEVEPAESSGFQWWIWVLVLGVACGAGVLMILVIMPMFKKKD